MTAIEIIQNLMSDTETNLSDIVEYGDLGTKETKRTKYYLICIDNHLFSCYTYPTKTKEVHYGTQ